MPSGFDFCWPSEGMISILVIRTCLASSRSCIYQLNIRELVALRLPAIPNQMTGELRGPSDNHHICSRKTDVPPQRPFARNVTVVEPSGNRVPDWLTSIPLICADSLLGAGSKRSITLLPAKKLRKANERPHLTPRLGCWNCNVGWWDNSRWCGVDDNFNRVPWFSISHV